jgi:ribulose-5-phosphate 4-epimerase/fuculose-1-phosphate aldolase
VVQDYSFTIHEIIPFMKDYKLLRKEIARFMRRLYDRGLTTASGGNISVRLEDIVFITSSAIDKGLIRKRLAPFLVREKISTKTEH